METRPRARRILELIGRGASVSAVEDMGGVLYAYFSDPDGNSWALQEIPPEVRPD